MKSRFTWTVAFAGVCTLASLPVAAETKDVRIFTVGSGPCGHDVDADLDQGKKERLALRQKEADVVAWRIKGNCKVMQQVAICPPTDQKYLDCFSVPGGSEIGKPISINYTERKALYCVANYAVTKPQFTVEIEVGDTAECGKRSERTHKLDIAIVP